MIRVNRLFYDDHIERELPAPPVLRENRTHYWIDPRHHDAAELLSDADYYDEVEGFDRRFKPYTLRRLKKDCLDFETWGDGRRIVNGARQTRRALLGAGTPNSPCAYGVKGEWCDHPQCPQPEQRHAVDNIAWNTFSS